MTGGSAGLLVTFLLSSRFFVRATGVRAGARQIRSLPFSNRLEACLRARDVLLYRSSAYSYAAGDFAVDYDRQSSPHNRCAREV